jgi:mannose-6-phosphate isomerase-like protein (cupin superfamily)
MAATDTKTEIAPFEVATVRPRLLTKGKTSDRLAKAGNLGIGVQVCSADGGETNLHSHPNADSAWMVLSGEAKFYTVGDKEIAHLRKNELVTIPAGTPYWFDVANKESGENLVILHVTSRIPGVTQGRIDYEPLAGKLGGVETEYAEGKVFES